MTLSDPDFLDFSRKLKLFSDEITVKLPLRRKDRDKKLLESLAFNKEMTMIISQILHSLYFLPCNHKEW